MVQYEYAQEWPNVKVKVEFNYHKVFKYSWPLLVHFAQAMGKSKVLCCGGNWVCWEENSESKFRTRPWNLCSSTSRDRSRHWDDADAAFIQEARCSPCGGFCLWSPELGGSCEACGCCDLHHVWGSFFALTTCWCSSNLWRPSRLQGTSRYVVYPYNTYMYNIVALFNLF